MWKAPADAAAYEVVKSGGAEGEVSFGADGIRVVKTNAKGRIRIFVREPVKAPNVKRLRVAAEVESSASLPVAARGYLRLGLRRKDGEVGFQAQAQGRTPGGKVEYDSLIVTPPGRPQLKATYWERPSKGAEPSVCLCVEGAASVSTWRKLRVEDVRVVEKANRDDPTRGHGRDFAADQVPDDELDRRLAADVDHVAKVVKTGDFAQLTVDGRAVPPILYKGGGLQGERLRFGGKAMHAAGVPLLVASVRFGATADQEGPWTTNGFDVAAAVGQIRAAMRTAPDALYVLTLRLDAPIGYCDTRPDEVWRTKDGEAVYGTSVHVVSPKARPKSWPWVSCHSRVWRRDVKDVLTAFFAELRRTGLLKRVVGVHLGGGHDAQFATAVPDWSAPARKAFAASGETDYARFLKRAPMELQDDFARHVRAEAGKDIVLFRWCMAAFGTGFSTSHDIREFADSKEIDVIVPQPAYARRLPGYAIGVKLPFSSFHRNGKLLVHEHDLRTYASWPNGDTAVRDASLSRATDVDAWRTVNRKTAGQMIARRTGFWYFDMESGWFDPPEIAADIASVVETARFVYCERPTPWRPSAALVVDEADLLGLQRADGPNDRAAADLSALVAHVAESGVPFDVWMKGDFDRTDRAVPRYPYVLRFDRHAEMKTAAQLNAEAKAAGAYVPLPPNAVQVDMNGDFVSLHCLVPGRYDFVLPRPCGVVNLKSGSRESVADGRLKLNLSPGETCWFRLVPFNPLSACLTRTSP